MQNSVIVPVGQPTSSVVIQAEAILEDKYTHEKPVIKRQVLRAMADFLIAATKEVREARAHNRATLRHLQ